MYSPAISPHDPNDIFLVCDMGGQYRSADDGQRWEMQAAQSLVSTVKGKVQFTSDPNILYTVRRSTTNLNDPLWRGELAKSTDGGASWQAMSDPTESGVHRLEVDPGSTQRLIINEYNHLYFSGDGGSSWSMVYQPSDDQMWLGGAFWDGQNIYVGTNHGLLVSKNGGMSFTVENHNGLPVATGIYHLVGAKAGATTRLFCIPAPASEMYAWLEPLSFDGLRQGVFRMNYAANASWANTRGNIPTEIDMAWVDLAKTNIQIVWAEGTDAQSFTKTYKSTNGGQSWTSVYQTEGNQNISTGWVGADGAFWLQQSGPALGLDVDDKDPNHVIRTNATVEITNDGGASWRAAYVLQNSLNPLGQPTPIQKFYQSSGLEVTTTHQIFWKSNQDMYLCNTDIGLTYSPDAGNSWTFARNTFFDYGPVANNNWYRMVERPDNHELFAAVTELNDLYLEYRTSDSEIEGAGGLVVHSTDGGTSWDTLYNFGHPVVWLELDKNNPAQMWASVVHHTDGGIFSTSDGGQTWTKLNAPPRTEGHPYNIISLANGGLLTTYSARKLDDGKLTESSGVFFSPDGGNTWLDRTAPPMRFYTKDLVVDPHDPAENTWYSTVWGRNSVWPGPNNQDNGGLYKTTDGGLTWTRIFSKTPSDQTESITLHPSKPGQAYLAVENDGLYFTENLDTATPVFAPVTSFPWWRPKRVFFNPMDHKEVWVSSMGGGVWKGIVSPAGSINYAPTTEDFANPERGFMQFTETNSTNYTPLNATDLAFWRTLNQPFGADYAIYSTLGYRGFYLESFTNGPISNAYLNAMQQDFAAARQAGVKFVVRFAYTNKETPPYGDAPKSIVLQHIAQLKPVLLANADVIAVLNMGFIGTWGEGYYTDYFGDASQPPYGLTAQNWNDRTEVLNALLNALPADRSVQVRVPQMKQKAIYGAAAPTTAAPLMIAEAWQNTPKARIGFANDCFLSSFNDQGTYVNYDPNASGCDTCVLKPYFSTDSQFVPVGGETCIDWNPYSDCVGQPGGGTQNEMARMHFSYLNAGWNNDVNNDWVSGGCMEEIKQRLGYRFELQTGEFPTEARPGQTISIKINLKNKGFAAPFNPRLLRLILRNANTHAIWQVELPDNPRSWLPGNQTHTIEHTYCLPPDLPVGSYELLLHLADPYPALTNRPEYAIRLANENTWEAATGFNRLLHQITINNTANSPACSGSETCFQPAVLTVPLANFTATATSGCAPFTVTFSNQSASCWDYEWSFPGGTPATSTEPNPTVVYQNAGAYDVGLSVTNAAGTGTSLKNSYITAAKVSVNETHRMCQGGSAICAGEEFFAPGNFPVTLTTLQGCDSVVNCNITIVPTYISQIKFVNLCFPSTYQVCNEMYSQTGFYATSCTGFLGCDSIVNTDLAVMRPIAQVAPPTPLDCEPNAIVTLNGTVSNLNTATGGVTLYEWIGPGILGANNLSAVQVNMPGQYCLLLTHRRGGVSCTDTACVTVSVNPVVTFNNGMLTSTPASAYQWLLNGDSIPGETSQTFVPTVSGDYSVRVDCQGTGWIGSNVIPVVIVGVSEADPWKLKIYPNPIGGHDRKLVLEIQGLDSQAFTLVLVDIAGRVILRKLVTDCSEKTILEIEEIPQGVYFVHAWQEGKILGAGKFLKI